MLALVFAMVFVAVASIAILGRAEFLALGVTRSTPAAARFKRIIHAQSLFAGVR
jgi:hypothetical protein